MTDSQGIAHPRRMGEACINGGSSRNDNRLGM
ncbi:MAG: hypothetical protein AAFV25_12735 [Bacteroidota bacterium]